MNILDTHNHKLRFNIDKDVPEKYMKRWKKFKSDCESGNNRHIVEQIKNNCKLQQNKNLPYLDRCEGGMGGNNNRTDKQIRFRDYELWSKCPIYIDNDIIFDRIENSEIEKWTYSELDDIMYAFIKTANYNVKAEYIRGCIEMRNKNVYSDNYLDSDSD